MKKFIALVLSLVMLLTCAAAMAETETDSLGILKVTGVFNIQYHALPDDYTIHVYRQNDMALQANISTPRADLPKMGLDIFFTDEWADTERLNDVSEEDLEAIKDDFYEEYDEINFEIRETAEGTKLLCAMVTSYQDAYIYTIYKGYEIEIQLFPGEEQDALTDADIDRVVSFLSDLQFVPVEQAEPAAQ